MSQKIRVLLQFDRKTDSEVVATAGAVLKGMTGNKAFPNPPVDLAEQRVRGSAPTARGQGAVGFPIVGGGTGHARLLLRRDLAQLVDRLLSECRG